MSNPIILLTIVVVLFLLLFNGVWVFAALGIAGVLGIWLFGVNLGSALSLQMWGTTNSFILTAVPLFIFLGEIMLRSGISASLYKGIITWVGQFPGGLIHSNIVACALFAAISGSSVATAATIGTVAIPDQEARRYDRSLILGSITASGTLGILIPPSIIMIIYGSWMEVSIAKLFMGGVIPGVIIALMFMVYIVIKCSLQPNLAPRVASSWRQRALSIKDIWPSLVIILFIVLAIYTGLMTPTETAAVSAVAALVITLILRRFSFSLLYDCAFNAVHTTAMLMIIVVGAKIFVMALIYLKLTTLLPALMESLNMPPLMVLIFIYVIYLVLGCFFDSISLLMVTLPFVGPVLHLMGIDFIWFGIVATILVEIGLITPPVGMNLYVIMGIAKNCSLSEITRAILPFFFMLLIGVVLLNVFPQLALWLPSTMVAR